MPNCEIIVCIRDGDKCDCGAVYCTAHMGQHYAQTNCKPKSRRGQKAEAPASPDKASPPEDVDETSASAASPARRPARN